MAAQNALYRSGTYHGTVRYANSGFGSVEQLLQDLRSELLVEKEKRLIAENRASDLAKQMKEFQELTRFEMLMEGDRRKEAEKRNRDLERQLRKTETEVRKKADETLSREQPLLRKGGSALPPVDRTSAGRTLNGTDRVENGRQRIGNQDALRRISSLNHHTFCHDSSSSNNDKADDGDDAEWQFVVRHNERILQKPGRPSGKLTRKTFPDNHSLQKSSSVSTERRNVITHSARHDGSQSTRPVAGEHIIRRDRSVHERTQSAVQGSSGQSGVSGLVQVTEQVSQREGNGNTRGAEYVSRGGGADDNGIVWGADHTSIKGKTSNWSASERSEDELRRQATLTNGYGEFPSKVRINEAKKSMGKKVQEAEKEEVPRELHQDSATATISLKDAADVTAFPNSSSLKTDTYADPAFKPREHTKIFWEQIASIGQMELQVQSPGDKALEESDATNLPIQTTMKLRAKWETTPSSSEV